MLRRWLACVTIILLTVSLSMARAQTELQPDSVQLVLGDAPASLTKGQTFIVNVVSRMETPTYGFGFQVQFDPKQLQVFPRPGRDGASVPLVVGELFGRKPQGVKNAVEAVPNTLFSQIDVVYTLLPPAAPMQGQGVLGSIAFTVIGESKSDIRLLNPRLIQVTNGQAADIPLKIGTAALTVDTTSASVVAQSQPVSSPAAPSTTTSDSRLPIIIALVIALLIAVIVTLIFARKLRRSV
jgi:hypothetical protein